jgi:predicted AAA+ superfamily ATPase
MSIYGGFPAVYLSENDEERREVLAEIYNSYIRKDVVDLMNSEVTISFPLKLNLGWQYWGVISEAFLDF